MVPRRYNARNSRRGDVLETFERVSYRSKFIKTILKPKDAATFCSPSKKRSRRLKEQATLRWIIFGTFRNGCQTAFKGLPLMNYRSCQ